MRSRVPRNEQESPRNFIIDCCGARKPAPRHHGECPRPAEKGGDVTWQCLELQGRRQGREPSRCRRPIWGAGVMIGRMGDDDFGKRLLSHLQSSQVDTKHVRIDPAASSGMSVAIIDAEGDYGAVIVSGANLRLAEEDIRDALEVLQRASVLVLQNEIPDAANVLAAEAAKGQGARVVFNAAPTRPLDPLLAQNVDILVVNAVEAEMMCGVAVANLAGAAEAAARLSSQVTNVIVTAGGMGLAVAERGQSPQA